MAPKKMIGLPISITGPIDLGRVIRELDLLDTALLQAKLAPEQTPQLPKTSRFMDQIVEMNKLDLAQPSDRQALKQFLVGIHDQAPRLHVSFSADPSEQFLEKFVQYLRQSIHPLVLVTVGLQPGIGAGCMVRTTNKYFDFSLGSQLAKQRTLLMEKLNEQSAAQPAAAPAPEVAA